MPYIEISRDRQTLTERNVWFRNAGGLWLIIGGIQLAATWSATGGQKGWFQWSRDARTCQPLQLDMTGCCQADGCIPAK